MLQCGHYLSIKPLSTQPIMDILILFKPQLSKNGIRAILLESALVLIDPQTIFSTLSLLRPALGEMILYVPGSCLASQDTLEVIYVSESIRQQIENLLVCESGE